MSRIKVLRMLTGQNFILPFYHAVADDAPVHLKHLYKVRKPKTFENDLDFLLKHYTAISLTDIHKHLQAEKTLPKHSFFLSFDDGLSEFKEIAWPIIKRKGIPVTLFVNPDFVDNKALFYRFKAAILIDFIHKNQNSNLLKDVNKVFSYIISSVNDLESILQGVTYTQQAFLDDLAEFLNISFDDYLINIKPYLSKNELLELQLQDVYIGAHSMDHPLFNQLSEKTMYRQVKESINWVQSNFNQSINSFSFPFTDFGVKASFFEMINEVEEPLIDITFGTAGLKREKFKNHFQRIPVEDGSSEMKQLLKRHYLYYLAKAPVFRNTIIR